MRPERLSYLKRTLLVHLFSESQKPLTSPKPFTVATYSSGGSLQREETVSDETLKPEHLDYFREKFLHLSGDLELPFEDALPGEFDFIDYRIGSDLNGAYVLYYFHDEVIFASLLLSGTDDETETELMQVFKFLLLDTDDQDEPTEEEIEEVLNSSEFDFPAIENRPAVFEVQLSGRADEEKTCAHASFMNRHLSQAFFELQERD